MSLLGSRGDLDYTQAPFCAVKTEEELEAEYGWDAAHSATATRLVSEAVGRLWVACDQALGLSKPATAAEEMWVDQCKSVADQHFGGDVRRATYLLKEIYLMAEWEALRATYSPVDYEAMTEEQDGTNFVAESACAGGACIVSF